MYQAVVAKTFDGYLNNGTVQEPMYWWPSWYDIYGIYKYNVSLAQDNTTGLYLNINATSDQTNLNATNMSPVFFQSTDRSNLTSNTAQDLVNEVWDSFLDGTWGNNMTYALNNTIGVRTWNFAEDEQAMFNL